MYEVYDHPPIQPEEGSISTSATEDTAYIGTAGMLKCSLQQCKNIDASADIFSCCYKEYVKTIRQPCCMAFLWKNSTTVIWQFISIKLKKQDGMQMDSMGQTLSQILFLL